MTVLEEKQRLRATLLAVSKQLSGEYIALASADISKRLLAQKEYQQAGTVFCYVGMPFEVDTRAVLAHALDSGKRVCVPRCLSLGDMALHQITSLDELSSGAYGIPEPPVTAPILHKAEVDFAVIPCLACDTLGNRLGKGGGFYDRFFADYRGAAAMLCFDRLLQPRIPVESHDVRVDCVITQSAVWRNGCL